MSEFIVTRHGQITLPKEIREELDIHEGDTLVVNRSENIIFITKKDKSAWDKIKGGSLPKNFDSVLKTMRSDYGKRLKKLGLV